MKGINEENSISYSKGLYNPKDEHDACGIGAIANIRGIKSHKLIQDALTILKNLEHRGGSEENSGDGAGILFQIPHDFFKSRDLGFNLPEEGDYAVAQVFLSQNENDKKNGLSIIKKVLQENNIELLGFRDVPTNPKIIGESARESMPFIMQFFVKKSECIARGREFERHLYTTRRIIEKLAKDISKFYISSFSSKTIVYKGMLISTQVSDFYLDLQDLNIKSAICLVHSRFSTNTFPSWERAHPNRLMAHNGEINTINGNINAMRAREGTFQSDTLDLEKVFPIIAKYSSDSAMFDNTLEFLVMNGRSIEEAIMLMIPEPWSENPSIGKAKRDFYEFNSTLMEPWDGPASIIFSDGDVMGASLDRNGFRPSRYYITKDHHLILSSETGALSVDESNILIKSRLQPGKLLLVDTKGGRLISDEEVKMLHSLANPYSSWVKNILHLDGVESSNYKEKFLDKESLIRLQKSFGYNYDEVSLSIEYMSVHGEEMIASMGVDTPIALLSAQPKNLFDYFKQLFAQVTNPPLDAIREKIVTSSIVYLGREGNLLNPNFNSAKRIRLNRVVITNEELSKIKNLETNGFKICTISLVFNKIEIYQDVCGDYEILEIVIQRIIDCAIKAIQNGAEILVLSDRGVDKDHVAIPSLLATASLHNFLVKTSNRTKVSIIVESGEPREIHHFACLLGYGASAINPYLVYESIKDLINDKKINLIYEKAIDNFIKASCSGIVKIASKMGVSTIQSYCGAGMFEVLGISSELVDKYFCGTSSNIEGITLKDILNDTLAFHNDGFGANFQPNLESIGLHGFRSIGRYDTDSKQEMHLYDPLMIYKLQNSCKSKDYSEFKEYCNMVDSKISNIRDCMDLDYSNSISIDEVESVESIMQRFKTGAMSYGSISKEAHECLAIAMNRIGAKSNTGEGGEDEERFHELKNGDSLNSKIKQVASARFGVSLNYLTNAKEIQIKIAQGAKPGEGGQLPGNKVYPWIARSRHSTPGVSLISPPPHHDIYSIEDLAQLIFDLKNVNENAKISVKLVSRSGIGTVAAGVAKAGANSILVSGYDGGTGASPRTSIANAGTPWEIGLSEVHQVLILNGLRDRVKLETDGKLLTGRDLAIAILLGAEEFGFSTAPLIVIGCTMMRVCSLNTCPFGIATQDKELRARFNGKPEYVINFMRFIAQNLREHMARLGFKSINEMIGRSDKLRKKKLSGKISKISLDRILHNPLTMNKTALHFKNYKLLNLQNSNDKALILPQVKAALKKNRVLNLTISASNITSRTLGTLLSSKLNKISKSNKEKKLEDNTINITAIGNGGNSFGAFLAQGVTLRVVGDVNDYLGKGLSGGRIIVCKSSSFTSNSWENVIAGNVCLYGAISGDVYLDGIAGERFCVRNSGANAVVLGVGMHGCEYMTGGIVVVLGSVGMNFAAGMSGGVAYIYDRNNVQNINSGLVDIKELDSSDKKVLKELIQNHANLTNSIKSKQILESFNSANSFNEFFKVMPRDYEKMLRAIQKHHEKEDPKLSAFLEITKC